MEDLKLIKKHYGEKMMKLCRELFPTILETEGLLFSIISEHFSYSRFLYEDIINNHMEVEFKDYIFSFVDVENKKIESKVLKSPEELLDEAGYKFFECHNEEEIQRFRKYYAPGEELCTFKGGRLERCHVFFAVKKDVDRIKREDFTYPERQDEYGTSVISIQFTKDSLNTLSIKNRYNHTVNNPDATFSNDLDNIIPGLTESFNSYYNLHTSNDHRKIEIPNYVEVNGKYYKYNYEVDNVYYCPNNIIIDYFNVKEYDKSQYIIIDDFILDLTNKNMYSYVRDSRFCFSLSLVEFKKMIGMINSIRVEKDKETGDKNIIINDDIIIVINSKNQMIKYINNQATKTGDSFLRNNKTLEYLEMNNVEEIGANFLYNNNALKKLVLRSVVRIGDNALRSNNQLEKFEMPKVRSLGNYFAYDCQNVKSIYMPELEIIGDESFYCDNQIEELDLPEVTFIGKNAFHYPENLRVLRIPKVKVIGDGAFTCVSHLEEVHADNAETLGNYVFRNASLMKKISLPNAINIGDAFLYRAKDIEEVNIPNIDEKSYNMLRRHVKEALIGYERGVK